MANDAGYPTCSFVRVFVLPNADYVPTGSPEPFVRIRIAALVCRNLVSPERCVCLRPSPVLGTSMPKAPIHEDGHAGGAEGYVDLAAHVGKNAAMDPKPESETVELGTELALWTGITTPIRNHSVASLLGGGGRDVRPGAGLRHA